MVFGINQACNYCVYCIFIILSFIIYQRVVNAEVHKSWVADCNRNYILLWWCLTYVGPSIWKMLHPSGAQYF